MGFQQTRAGSVLPEVEEKEWSGDCFNGCWKALVAEYALRDKILRLDLGLSGGLEI